MKKKVIAETETKDNSPYVFQRNKIDYPLHIKELPWTPKQKELLALIQDKNTRLVLLNGPAGSSKAQPLDAEILTPNGYVKMGNIKVGDFVFAEDGNPVMVKGVFPQGMKPIYQVKFSDDTSTECCGEHLWETQTINDRNARTRRGSKNRQERFKSPRTGTVKTTDEIKNSLYVQYKTERKLNHTIPITAPVCFSEKAHLIHPYILGVLLGDGSLKNSLVFTTSDQEIAENVNNLIPIGYDVNKLKAKFSYSISFRKTSWWQKNPMKEELTRLGINLNAYDKFIPLEYQLDSVENRLALLRGLMDTDGTTNGYSTNFCSTSIELAKGVRFLVESLGGTAKICNYGNSFYYKNGEKKICREYYCVFVKLPAHINPFLLKRKRDKVIPCSKYVPRRYIVDIIPIGEKECQCILVDNPRHLYLTNNFIVTHNTICSIYCALKALNDKKNSHILYSRPALESADSGSRLGMLPGEIGQKIEPYTRVIREKMEELLPKNETDKLNKENRIEFIEVNYIRGASLNAVYLVLDECQNFTLNELITLITRIGKYSKIILCADPMQSDLPVNKQGGFMKLWSLFNCEESQKHGIFRFEFLEEDILRSDLCKFIVHKTKELKNEREDNGQHQKKHNTFDEWTPSRK